MQLVNKCEELFQFWKKNEGVVISTSVTENSADYCPAHELRGVLQSDRRTKILLIIGSEGKGVSSHLAKLADYTTMVERIGKGEDAQLVDSLNVNSALTALLY